jgi:hypothetical protein
MGIYSGAEVFQIAMELEEAGRVFYETLAEKSADRGLADLCRELAVQEADHYRKFKKMGEELVERPASRPLTWDELNFAQILIEERVLSDPEAARDAAASGDVAALLETAIRLEKTAFFSTMNCCLKLTKRMRPLSRRSSKKRNATCVLWLKPRGCSRHSRCRHGFGGDGGEEELTSTLASAWANRRRRPSGQSDRVAFQASSCEGR